MKKKKSWNSTEWNDEWIVAHLYDYPSYKSLAEEHNRLFGTNIAASTIGGHVKNDLKIQKKRLSGEFLTDEQKRFIEEYYPKHTVDETTREFNKRFKTEKQRHTMLNYARRHNIKVDEKIVTQAKIEASHAKGTKRPYREIGDIRYDGRYWVVKTECGWKNINRAMWEKHHGKVKKNHAIIFLDGDCKNWSIENLAEVPRSYLGMLDRNGFRSRDAEITKTGIVWCELSELLEKEGVEMNKRARNAYERYCISSNTELADVYGKFSNEKKEAWKYCKELCERKCGRGLKIISANRHQFTAGFLFAEDDKEKFMYITKESDTAVAL